MVRELREAGYVTGTRTLLQLTDKGWAHFAGVDGAPAGEVLDRVLDSWPQAHHAFVGLLVSSIVARHHLADEPSRRHLGYMAIGEPSTGKSAIGALVCALFGWPHAEHQLHVPAQSVGGLLGRHVIEAGGLHRWEPAATTRLPFVVLDEFDKAPEPVRQRALVFLSDGLQQRVDDEVHTLLPTALVLANPPKSGDRYGVLRPYARSRSVVLDTAGGRPFEDVFAATFESLAPGDRLNLDALKLPARRLPDSARAVLRSMRDTALTDEGREDLHGLQQLETAALGRWALLGADASPELAAWSVATAYLLATETVPGMVDPRWHVDFAALRPALGEGADVLAAAQERGRAERDAARQQVRTVRVRDDADKLEVLSEAGSLASELDRLADALDGRRLPEQLRDQAAGPRRVLRMLAKRARELQARATLEDVQALAGTPRQAAQQIIGAARQLVDDKARRRADEAARAADMRQRKKANAVAERERRRLEREAALSTLWDIVFIAQQLEGLYRRTANRAGESALAVLRGTKAGARALLRYTPDKRPQERRGFLDALADVLAGAVREEGTWWCQFDPTLRFRGTATSCPELSRWGDGGTRRVLAAPLSLLYVLEDELRAQVGRGPRKNRVTLPAGYAAPATADAAAAFALTGPVATFPTPYQLPPGRNRYGLPQGPL